MKNYIMSEMINEKGNLICPVCEKEFKPTADTKYIVSGGYTCSWKCFLKEVKQYEKDKINK